MLLSCGRFTLDLCRPLIMGVVNLTGDSFSGDGHARDSARAVAHALRLRDEGADILDLGAESSRPGAEPVAEAEELARLLPVIDALRDCGLPLSVDTMKPATMRAVLSAGVDMINDIAALEAPGAIDAVKDSNAALCLMHMRGQPQTMQQDPHYDEVVAEVSDYLARRVAVAETAGIARSRLVVDPGFGFGKTYAHNLSLFHNLALFQRLGLPLLVGVSRKSMIGQMLGKPPAERAAGSVAAAMLAAQRGAAIVRVHDVAATRDALAVLQAL